MIVIVAPRERIHMKTKILESTCIVLKVALLVAMIVGVTFRILFGPLYPHPEPFHQTNPPTITTGYANVAIGINAAKNLTTGSGNFCYGDDACPTITIENCVIDIRPLGPQIALPATEYIYSMYPLEGQSRLCGYDRTLAILDDLQAQSK